MSEQAITKVKNEVEVTKTPLVMKSGLVHWLSAETAKRLEQSLATQQAHGFIRIQELGITINTAEIGDGILTLEQYASLEKRKAGMWQCVEGNWHEKKIRDCTCHQDRIRDGLEKQRRERAEKEYAPLTPAQAEENKERTKKAGELMVLRGVLSHERRTIRRSTLIEFQESGETMKVHESALQIEEDMI
jgi:hypothetical protein